MDASPHELASLRAVRKQYGKLLALDGIDLAIAPGQVLALLGANGAGKTTAIALLLGLVRPDAGQALLFGRSPQQLAARRNIGVMLQSAGIADNSKVRELLELIRSYYPQPRSVDDCVALAGLDGLLGRQYGTLSGLDVDGLGVGDEPQQPVVGRCGHRNDADILHHLAP